MLTASDFIHLPYTLDLTQAGMAYACRSLAYTYNRMGGSQFDRLRRIVVGKAVELAFRRFLVARQIPPFTDPDHYDIALGGWRCDIKSFLLHRKRQISMARKQPGSLLKARALVPVDQVETASLDAHKLYVFAYVSALLAPKGQSLARAHEAGQPIYSLYPFPPAWSRPTPWKPLTPLALKTDLDTAISIEIGGQSSQRQFQTELLHLSPRQRVETQKEYYSLAFLRTEDLFHGRIGVYSKGLEQLHLIPAEAWENIGVYGLGIQLCGYMPAAEFLARGQEIPPGSKAFPYTRTRTRNIALPVAELHPLSDLLTQAQQWHARHK